MSAGTRYAARCAVAAALALLSWGAPPTVATAATTSATAIPSTTAFPSAGPIRATGQHHEVHITIASVYVHDDADKGIYGCGEFNHFHVDLNGTPVLSPQRNWLLALPPLFQAGTMDVKYCSDHQYLMPADLPPGINTYVISAVPGHVLALTGAATEYDNFSNHTTGAGAIPLAVPDPGLHAETTLEIEGSNSHGHMRLDLLIRVHTL